MNARVYNHAGVEGECRARTSSRIEATALLKHNGHSQARMSRISVSALADLRSLAPVSKYYESIDSEGHLLASDPAVTRCGLLMHVTRSPLMH